MRTIEEITAYIDSFNGPPCEALSQQDFEMLRAELRAAYTIGIEIDRLKGICKAEREGRLVVLPVPIGKPIYLPYRMGELSGVEEHFLSGYIREGEKEWYTTWEEPFGADDVAVDKAFGSYAEAEAFLEKMMREEEGMRDDE